MPWIRIDEHAMEHPKLARLGDGAFRLWVQGLAHCQKFLTDGFIDLVSCRAFHAYAPKRKADLLAAGVWELSDGGVRVHDYLQWNDTRASVLAARDGAAAAREETRVRVARHRSNKQSTEADMTPADNHGVTDVSCNVLQPRYRNALRNADVTRYVTRYTPVTVGVCTNASESSTTLLRNTLRQSQSGGPGEEAVSDAAASPAAHSGAAAWVHDGPRLRVFRWMHADFVRRLGATDFDLLGWYQALERELGQSGEAFAEPFRWLCHRLQRDAKLPMPSLTGRAQDGKSKLTQALERASDW